MCPAQFAPLLRFKIISKFFREEHEKSLLKFERLTKARGDALDFIREVIESHQEEFEQDTKAWKQKVDNERAKRLFERRKIRARRRKEEYDQMQREKEEEERRAEAERQEEQKKEAREKMYAARDAERGITRQPRRDQDKEAPESRADQVISYLKEGYTLPKGE